MQISNIFLCSQKRYRQCPVRNMYAEAKCGIYNIINKFMSNHTVSNEFKLQIKLQSKGILIKLQRGFCRYYCIQHIVDNTLCISTFLCLFSSFTVCLKHDDKQVYYIFCTTQVPKTFVCFNMLFLPKTLLNLESVRLVKACLGYFYCL